MMQLDRYYTCRQAAPWIKSIPMSYDILVFDPAHAPTERQAFLEWWHAQADWSEPHPYNDPAFTTPNLRAWFMEND